jgi:transcriptional regulator with XRE-family HTH domain
MIDLRRLKALRAYHGLTQKDVEDKTGIPFRTYRMREIGEAKLNVDECLKLAKLYKLTLKEFNEIFLGGELE